MDYKAIKKNIFTRNGYSIRPLRSEDMESIRIWRNSQLKVLRQKAKLTVSDQENYFQNFVKPLFENEYPGQLLFSYFINNVHIGYGGLVNVSWLDFRAEMSFLVNPERANQHELYAADFSNFIDLMKELIFDEMRFNRLFTETYEFRDFHISVLEKNGFVLEGLMRDYIFEDQRFYDSLLHNYLKSYYDKSKK